MVDIDELERLLAAATPGEWRIWFEQINGQAEKAIQELSDQVHATAPIGNSLVMLDADGKCPAVTGCGPTSVANAALIVAARNSLPAMIAEIRELRAENARLRPLMQRLCLAYEMICEDAGKPYHKSKTSVYAICRAALGEPQ